MHMNEALVMQHFKSSKSGYVFLALEQPMEWKNAPDKKAALDYYFTHATATFCNKAYLDLMLLTEENVLGKTPADFFSYNIDYGKLSVRELLENGFQSIGAFEMRPGVWHEGNTQCIYDELGRITGHMAMVNDVSGSKRDEHYDASQSALRQNTNFQYCHMADGSGHFVSIGYQFFDMFGVMPDKTPETMRDLYALINLGDAERIMALLAHILRHPANIDTEFRINHPAKGIRWIKVIAIPDTRSEGKTVWNGYFSDYTERKKTDSWISFLNTALMNISDSVILTNTAGEITYANRRAKELHGYELAELLGLPTTALRAEPVTAEEEEALTKTLSEGKTFTSIGMSRRKDGSVFTCEYAVTPMFDEYGALSATIGIQNDITERINMLDALRQTNEKLRATLLSVGEGVISTDARGIVTMMNAMAEQLTGYRQVDVVGKAFSAVFHTVDETTGKPGVNPAEIVLKTSESYTTTDPVLLVQQSGADIPVEIHASPIKNVKGVTKGAVIVFRDFTEYRVRQKKIEYLSFHDPLTGLYNRRYMEDAVRRADLKTNLPLAIIIVDVNGLKLTNDAFGHKTGDQLLVTVADILRNTCKPDAVIARMGGDEFQILMTQTPAAAAEEMVRAISAAAGAVKLDSVIVSLAMGFAVKNDASDSIETVIMNADNQMYREKLKHGKMMRSQTIETVLRNINFKYDREQIHTERVSQYSEALAKAMGMSEQDVTDIKNAGVLHDIGKIVVPPELLSKADKLTDEEYEIVKRHSETGYQILKSSDEYAKLASFVLYHHERWDGRGYPEGLKGTEIPLQARMISVADAFEAMTAIRPYQKTRTAEAAAEELIRCAGKQFDPAIVDIFVKKVLS